jgi:GTPase Era involved in 16S rRNA processing
MKHPTQFLQSELDQVLDLLDQPFFLTLTAEERQSLKGNAQGLYKKLSAIESGFLTVGLFGGTGVGKSTLMNALAGSRVASISHRRPHTEKVLIYRHAEADPLPALALADVPWQEITHQADAIRQILVCDLPDYDSLVEEHRKRVLQFQEHLDVLVWVTSPEKYADGRFYELLQLVPKAKQNFYFVLNKVDILFHGQSVETGYEQMARVLESFQEHIRESGITEPLIYALAAEKALNSDHLAPWNQFPAFRQHIFQQRDVKQVTAIKAANLDVEVQELLSAFHKEVLNLETFEQTLEDVAKEWKEKYASWLRAGDQKIDRWLGRHITQETLSHQSDPSCLIGPSHTVAVFVQEWQKRFSKEKNLLSSLPHFALPEEIAISFQRQLEWLQNRINHRMLRKNLPPSFREPLQGVVDVSRALQEVEERFSHVLTLHLGKPRLPSFWTFRGLQVLTYVLLFAFLLFAIGGEAAWRKLLDDPGATSVLHLLVAGIDTLFSAKGLAALGSYALLNLFLAIRFLNRYKKLLRYATEKMIESLRVELSKVWEEELNTILEDLNRLKKDIRSQISTISAIKQQRQ